MPSGTFSVATWITVNVAGARSSTGDDTDTGWWAQLLGSTDADLIAGLSGSFLEYWAPVGGPLGVPELAFELDANTPCIVLDNVDFVSINDLPPGWLADTCILSGSTSAGGGSGLTSTTKVDIHTFNTGFQHNNVINEDLASGGALSPNDILNLILTVTLGGTVSGTPPPVGVQWQFLQLTISGTYTSINQTWTLETPTDPIEEGDEITVTSDPLDPDALDMTQIQTITLDWTDADGNPQSLTVLIFTAIDINHLIFTIPTLTGDPPIVIVTITSTQFSGSVELGKLLTIFFLNATGIYTLVPDKTNDTIYDNDNGGTIDVKIPNPFFKTGFIGG